MAHLLQQLKALARQHEQVLNAYERRLHGGAAPKGGGGGGGGGGVRLPGYGSGALGAAGAKRPAGAALLTPPGAPEGPEQKRMRLAAERELRAKAVWDECARIVDRLRRHGKAEPFKAPVDAERLRIPDYHAVIARAGGYPMDLGTVGRKLRERAYSSPLDFAKDVRQIWQNCRVYNPPQTPVAKYGEVMSEFWEKQWGQAQLDVRWAAETRRREREDAALAAAEAAGKGGKEGGAGGEGEGKEGGAAGAAGAGAAAGMDDEILAANLRDRARTLGEFIAARDAADGLAPGVLGRGAPDASRSMTFEEKRKLSAYLAALPGDRAGGVLEIVRQHHPLPAPEPGQPEDAEVVVDLDDLSNAALWALRTYVDAALALTPGGGVVVGVVQEVRVRARPAGTIGAPPKKGGGAATKGGAVATSPPGGAAPAVGASPATAPPGAGRPPAGPGAAAAVAAAAAGNGPAAAGAPAAAAGPHPPSDDEGGGGVVGSTAVGGGGPGGPGYDGGTMAQSGTGALGQGGPFLAAGRKPGAAGGVDAAAMNTAAWANVGGRKPAVAGGAGGEAAVAAPAAAAAADGDKAAAPAAAAPAGDKAAGDGAAPMDTAEEGAKPAAAGGEGAAAAAAAEAAGDKTAAAAAEADKKDEAAAAAAPEAEEDKQEEEEEEEDDVWNELAVNANKQEEEKRKAEAEAAEAAKRATAEGGGGGGGSGGGGGGGGGAPMDTTAGA